jgi:hypothetical protein
LAIDSTKLNNLLAMAKPAVAEILRVQWSDTDWRYYAISKYDEIVPFREVKQYLDNGNSGLGEVEATLIGKEFHSFNICATDVENDEISFTFSNIDKEISDLFNEHGDGVKCSLFYYYPEADIFYEIWWGQLHKGAGDYQVLPVRATNGYTPIDFTLPNGKRSVECPFTFGYHIKTVEQIEVNGCPYDRHLGGSVGNLDPDTGLPYTDCPRLSKADSVLRLGTDKYFGGIKWKISGVITDPSNGYTAQAMPTGEKNKEPLRVIAGERHIHDLILLYFRRELNASNPARGFVRAVFEIGEGSNDAIYNFKMNEKFIEQLHIQILKGYRGQSPLPTSVWGADMNNFSSRSVISGAYGWVDPASINPQGLTGFVGIRGFNKVAVFTDADSYTRIWSNERPFWILEAYTNPTWGKGYQHNKFWIEDFIAVAEHKREYVRFTHPNPDASTQYFDYRRDKFDAVFEPRPSSQVIEEMCYSGMVSVPFQYEGKYTISAFRKATTDELNSAKVFTDSGENRNIIFEDGQPSLRITQISNEELINEVELVFNDGDNLDLPRPITVDDPNQKRLAGGGNEQKPIPKQYNGFGISPLNIAVKVAYALLWFGKFDEGGIKNNCRVHFKATLEQVLGRKKYEIIKVVSSELDGYGYTNPLAEDFYQFEYFRILDMEKLGNNEVMVTAQAYNHGAYTTFETPQEQPENFPAENEPTMTNRQAPPCNPDFTAEYANGLITVTTDEC